MARYGSVSRCARRLSTRSLEEGDGKQGAHHPPLVLVDVLQACPNFVFKGVAAVPKNDEANHHARDDEGEELLGCHAQVANKQAHDV